ncbi:MAG TPA: hypothetical protein VF945_11495 [Polyangia bacterium]
MDKTIDTGVAAATSARVEPARQAYHLLHWGFVAAPTIAGLDKFAHLLTNWDQYLARPIERLLPMSGHAFMLLVGVVEILAGLLVAVRPRIGAWVVAAWLFGIIVDLLLVSGFYDIALRDFGLMLAAIALARLSATYDRGASRTRIAARRV